MADHPLRPATRLCLGGPLHRQLADGPQAHPQASACLHMPTLTPSPCEDVVSCCISPPFEGLSTTHGQITYVLLTRTPLYRGRSPFSFDLHVLGAPLTFVLSQDQTLQLYPGPARFPSYLAVRAPGEQFSFSYRCSFPSTDSLSLVSFSWDPRSIFNYAYSSVFKDQGEPVVPGFVFPVSGEALSTSRHRGCQPLFPIRSLGLVPCETSRSLRCYHFRSSSSPLSRGFSTGRLGDGDREHSPILFIV